MLPIGIGCTGRAYSLPSRDTLVSGVPCGMAPYDSIAARHLSGVGGNVTGVARFLYERVY